MNKMVKMNAIPFFILLFFVFVVIVSVQHSENGLSSNGTNNFRIIYNYEYKLHYSCLKSETVNDNNKVYYISKSSAGTIPAESSKMYYFLQKETKLGWSSYGYCSESLEELTNFYDSNLHLEQQLSGKVYKLTKKENKL